jgi:hypothetical protein
MIISYRDNDEAGVKFHFQSEGIRVGRFNESPITNRLLLIIDTSPYGGFKLVYYSNGLPICSPSNGNKLRSLDSDTK